MSLYLFIAAVLFFISLPSMCMSNSRLSLNNYTFIFYYCSVIFLIFFAGLRQDVGFDFINYKNIFYGISDTSVELLYYLLQATTGLTGSYTFHLLVVALISILIKFSFFNKSLDSRLLVATIFFYFTSSFLILEMGVIRQSIAASFLLAAIYFFSIKNVKLFLFFSFLAIFFHISALAIVIIILLSNIVTLNRLCCVLMLSFSFLLMNLIGLFLSDISPLLLYFGDKYTAYINNLEPVGFTYGLLFKLFIFIFIYEVIKRKASNRLMDLLLFIYFSGLCIFIVFNSIPILAARLTPYFKVVEVILFVFFLLQFRPGYSRLLVFCFLSVFSFSQLMKFLNEDVVIEYYSNYSNFLLNVFYDVSF